ncbi:MAG: DUF1566 domain-containing protein [Pseudomonadota bacterium]
MLRTGKPRLVAAPLFIPIALISFALSALISSDRTCASEEQSVVVIGKRSWTTQTNGAYLRWRDAVDFCATLRLGGYEDWRLPTLAELESLYSPDTQTGIRSPIRLGGCCLWSDTSLEERPAADDEIAGRARFYRWGFMYDGGHSYYAGPYFEDGEALCTREN